MSATSAPRYFTHVNVNDASGGGPDVPVGSSRSHPGMGSGAGTSGPESAPPESPAPAEQWLDTGAPTDVDEGAPDLPDAAPDHAGGFSHDAKGGPMPPPGPYLWSAQERAAATSSVSAEAQQGDGPAAASASASAVGQTTQTMTVSVVVGPNGAAAAGPFGVVVAGPHGVAAASQVGVAVVGPHGAASASNAANSTRAVVDDHAARVEPERD